MASFAAACRLSSRLAVRQLRQENVCRGYRTSTACLAAQNFTMPALSPTMTEGNISSWRVKEGDSFSAGDVLLEIETDRASMDVEAQEDGILAKITQPDGTKGIQVGTRIGVIAEPGDDISSIEIPEEEAAATPPKKEASKSSSSEESESQNVASPAPKPADSDSSVGASKPKSGAPKKQTYPLLPSVEYLMHENGLDASAVNKMTPSGPNGRLLKGDVLAYLGTVETSYPAELSAKIGKLSHLDLSNIKIKAPPPPPPPKATAAAAQETRPIVEDLEVAVPISMAAVIEVQKRIQSTLGVVLPLTTFVARATDVANDDLPRSASAKPSADELFNQILGLDKVSSFGVRGNYIPQITALSPATFQQSRPAPPKDIDVIDFLTGKKSASRASSSSSNKSLMGGGIATTTNLFSITVPKGDEKRARVFLERVKSVLEEEPGRLVL